MIVVRVELWSAVSGERTELARMRISNDGLATRGDPALGTYRGETLKGRSAAALDRGEVTRRGVVREFPRLKLHLWFLVARMLGEMGYGPSVVPPGADQPTLPGLDDPAPSAELEAVNGRLA